MTGDIVYEDGQLLVFHKPAGLAAQTARVGQKDVVSLLKSYRVLNHEPPYIALLNRLDQPVEGLLLAAKTKEAAAALSRQLTEHTLEKYYRAVVWNNRAKPLSAGEAGTLTNYLLKDGRTNCSAVVKKETDGAKKAVLSYEVLRIGEQLAELRIRLSTGRHHQIRVQLAHASLPLLGDRKYGGTEESGTLVSGLALCSVRISFMHPIDRKKMEFEIEPNNPAFQLL